MRWCTGSDGGLWEHGGVLPCKASSAVGPVLVVLASVLSYGQWRRRVVLCRCPRQRWRPSGAGTVELVTLIIYAALAALHAGWIIADALTGAPPFAFLFEACLLVAWFIALVTVASGRMAGVTTHVRVLSWAGIPVYVWLAAESIIILHSAPAPLPPLPVAEAISCAVAAFLLLAASLAEWQMKPSTEEEEVLKQSLLGTDVEAGQGGLDPPKKRGWWKLMVTAVVYVWPTDGGLQLRAAICVLLVIVMRLLNLAVPILYRDVINLMSDVSTRKEPHITFWQLFYPVVALYLLAVFLQGGSGAGSIGVLNNARQYLWIPITQDAFRRISLDVFSHTLDLDLKFHLMRKTGEVTRVMDRGTSAIQNVLSTVLFNIVPQLFDVVAATAYIAGALTPWIAAIVFVTLGSYIPVTIILTEWRGAFRRDLNKYDNARGARVTDALLGYETVKYFSNERLERDRFADAIRDYLGVDFKLTSSLCALNVVQSIIIFAGLMSGLMVCVKGVADGSLRVGDTVLFLTMLAQLQGPLNFFGTYYRTIQQQMIDMENMFSLLATNASIKDKPASKDLILGPATVEFRDVSFEYSVGSPVVQDVSFVCPGGRTTAFVGATGSGKSTLLRLVFRFYDPTAGCILIDGQDIADVTQRSLRVNMAVVPQDTVLFNDNIRYNIRYGRPAASDAEVEAVAASASIHDAIVERFPQGYNTVVGERGLRLSGGEKQRVAFARALLKNPKILLLDEATSALDSLTERRIQEALAVMRKDRTTLIVAHRLSTIADAHQIVVMKEGRVVEVGSHPDLVARGGLYAEMWARQAEGGSDSRAASSANLRALEEGAALRPPRATAEFRAGGPGGDPPLTVHGRHGGHGGHGFHG